jgi:hypothetical protein
VKPLPLPTKPPVAFTAAKKKTLVGFVESLMRTGYAADFLTEPPHLPDAAIEEFEVLAFRCRNGLYTHPKLPPPDPTREFNLAEIDMREIADGADSIIQFEIQVGWTSAKSASGSWRANDRLQQPTLVRGASNRRSCGAPTTDVCAGRQQLT